MRHEPFAEFDAATSSERRKRLPQWCAWALGSAFIVYLFVNEFFRVTRGAGGKVASMVKGRNSDEEFSDSSFRDSQEQAR